MTEPRVWYILTHVNPLHSSVRHRNAESGENPGESVTVSLIAASQIRGRNVVLLP